MRSLQRHFGDNSLVRESFQELAFEVELANKMIEPEPLPQLDPAV